jgi:hypothetical protein
MATAKEAAAHILVSQREFRELLDLGVIERKVDSAGYDLNNVYLAYVRYLRRVIAGVAVETRSMFAGEEEDDGDDC